MHRCEAILVIVVLIAAPLTLLSDSMAGDAQGCGRFCCLPHAAHNSPMAHPMKAEKSAEMACHHGETGHMLECGMKSGRDASDFAFLAPIPPTVPSPAATLAAPEISRQSFHRLDESATPGILTIPFEPPRS